MVMSLVTPRTVPFVVISVTDRLYPASGGVAACSRALTLFHSFGVCVRSVTVTQTQQHTQCNTHACRSSLTFALSVA